MTAVRQGWEVVMRPSWETLAIGEGGLTATLAGLAAVQFLRRHAHERQPGRRTAALALGLSSAGAAVVATHTIAATLSGERSAGLSLLIGLPALAGQTLIALLAVRRRK
jgi:hypothetical protein